jgi:hypothetical protein
MLVLPGELQQRAKTISQRLRLGKLWLNFLTTQVIFVPLLAKWSTNLHSGSTELLTIPINEITSYLYLQDTSLKQKV